MRDCLKLLRRGAGLDDAHPSDCGEECNYMYIHDTHTHTTRDTMAERAEYPDATIYSRDDTIQQPDQKWYKRFWTTYEKHLPLPPVRRPDLSLGCDTEDPPIIHIYWQGAFTDKPYMAILSFLYTQNLGLHLDLDSAESKAQGECRLQLWMWMHQPHWAVAGNQDVERVMLEELRTNVWAAPFLHARFKDVVKFKVYDAEEQMSATAEFHQDWGARGTRLPRSRASTDDNDGNRSIARAVHVQARAAKPAYDLSTVASSDLVRFLLCHRYGGLYLDADTLLLRDLSPLLSPSSSAFAYRWSRLPRYNTAVLRLHKGSALGRWLVRTAWRNGGSFHPARVTRYVEDAGMDGLLRMLPVPLFDPAWLDVEGFERDRPPQPHLTRCVCPAWDMGDKER